MEEIKEILTIEELDNLESFDNYQYRTFTEDDLKTNLYNATEFVSKINGILYTQLDSGNSIVYAKDYHVVNRTGVYLVLYKFNPSWRF